MEKFYYIYAGHGNEYSFLRRPTQLIISEIKKWISNGVTTIVFDNSAETVSINTPKIQRIADQFDDESIEFIFLTGAVDGEDVYKTMCTQFGWKQRLKVKYLNIFERTAALHLLHLEEKEYFTGIRNKIFLSFNRVARPHRIMLLSNFLDNNLLESSFFSFEGIELNNMLQPIPNIVSTKQLEAIKNLLPIRLNITEDRTNPTTCIQEDAQYFDNSYLSVVTETIFSKNLSNNFSDKFFSEKIYKPISFKHPFILISWPGSLRELKNMGYKTFHPFINEEYDDIENDELRFNTIFKEIIKLSKFSSDEWIRFQYDVKHIVEHNYKVLRTKYSNI